MMIFNNHGKITPRVEDEWSSTIRIDKLVIDNTKSRCDPKPRLELSPLGQTPAGPRAWLSKRV